MSSRIRGRSNASTSSSRDASAGRSNESVAETASSGCRPRLLIKPLRTVGDTGEPTRSVVHDLERVINFIQDERHLVAFDLYSEVQTRLKIMEKNKRDRDAAADQGGEKKRSWINKLTRSANASPFNEEEYKKVKEFLSEHKDDLDYLEKKAPLFIKARDSMDDSEGWDLAQTLFGVTTFYRREDDGSLSIKLQGELKGIPLFEQVAVLREIDLHCHWAPFVTSSLTIAHLDKLDTVGWIMLGLPNFGLARDGCFRVIACDCVAEDGSFLMVGRGVEDRLPGVPPDKGAEFLAEDPVLKTLDIPPVPTRMGSGRMTIKMFEAKIRILGPDHCNTYILANVDPNLAFMPQAILEFVMKKLCGFLLNKLQTAAKKIIKDPVRNIHAQRMRDESAFYLHWVLPKFKAIAAERGWDVPTISAFELTEAQHVEAEKVNERRNQKMHSFSHFDDGSVSTRSEPALYHNTPRGSNDDDSDISSLSGTSQSLWKNNPIAVYLLEIESKTQERKVKALGDARRKAAARIQPRPIPMDKMERLNGLKRHKERKRQARSLSGLPSVDEDLPGTITETAAHWPNLWVVSSLVMLLFIILHLDRFLPTFSYEGLGLWSTVLRDAVTLVYIGVCGVIHFSLCDLGLVYAFEAFEMGMKMGDAVKIFYRSRVRLAIAVVTGLLVATSIIKAVAQASLLVTIASGVNCYQSFVDKHFPGIKTEYIVEEIADAAADEVVGMQVIGLRIPELLLYSYSTFMALMNAVFDLQVRVFVHSNRLGRSLESLIMGTYNLYIGFLLDLGNALYSLFVDFTAKDSLPSWRDDAIHTLRVLLLYTAFFLLVVLAMLNTLAKTYRHGRAPQNSTSDIPSVAPTSSTSMSEERNMTPSAGSLPIPSSAQQMVSPSQSIDSATRRRLKFIRRKRKESALDDDDSENS